MPTRIINGVNVPDNTSGYTSGNPVYVLDTVPQARQAANGLRPIRISGVHLDVGGGVNLNFGVWDSDGGNGAGSPTIGVGGMGRYSAFVSKYMANANLQDIRVGWFGATGEVNFGRAAVGGRTVIDGFGNYPDASLTGLWTYEQAPAAPTMVAATPGPAGKVTVQFSGGDDGDAAITGWYLQYADNAGFTGATTINSTGTSILTLTPGKTYWFRAAGRNNVTDTVGTTGAWSGAISAQMRSGGKVRAAGAWKAGGVKVRVAGVWRDGIIRVRSGGAWKDAL